MKLQDAVKLYNAVGEILENKMTFGQSFRFEKVLDMLKADIENYNNNSKCLMEKYGCTPDNNGDITNPSTAFVEEYQELGQTDVEYPGLPQFSRDDLEGFELRGSSALALKPILL